MERLTRRYETHIAVICEHCDKRIECRYGGLECSEVLRSRLAAYEDTIPLERAQELAQEEKDGRLVVLPDAKYTEADGEKALQKAMWACGNTNNPVTRYTADAIAEKLCREVKDENLPLTLEELREMDGEPIYVTGNGWRICYGLDESTPNPSIILGPTARMYLRGYGRTWAAYRRKPEEVTA